MSSSHVFSHRRKYKPPKRSKEEGHESQKIHLLKNTFGYRVQVANHQATRPDKFSKFYKSLEFHIQNIRDLTTKK